MTIDKEELIKNLQANIQQLKNAFKKEKEACLTLLNEKTELSKKLNEKETECGSLETKLNTLKLAKSLTGNKGDMVDAKLKVSNLVREIDKCIALLNR